LPQMVVVCDAIFDNIAVREARRMKIPIVGFVNTNANPEHVTHAIPLNTRSPQAIAFALSHLEEPMAEGKRAAKTKQEEGKTEDRTKDENRENV